MTPTTLVMLPVVLIAALGPPGVLFASLLGAAALDDAAMFFVGGSAIYVAWFVMLAFAGWRSWRASPKLSRNTGAYR